MKSPFHRRLPLATADVGHHFCGERLDGLIGLEGDGDVDLPAFVGELLLGHEVEADLVALVVVEAGDEAVHLRPQRHGPDCRAEEQVEEAELPGVAVLAVALPHGAVLPFVTSKSCSKKIVASVRTGIR